MAKGSGWVPIVIFGAVAVGAYFFRNEIFGFIDSVIGGLGSGGDTGNGDESGVGGGDMTAVPETPTTTTTTATTRRDERGGSSGGGSKTRLSKDEKTLQRMITNRNRNTTVERKLLEKLKAQGMFGRIFIG